MGSRRHALALLGSTATVGLSGCLFGGFGAGESGPPPTVSNRRVETAGSVPQYQVDADNAGVLPGAAPTDPSIAWRRTPNRYDAAQPVVDGDAIYVAFDGALVSLAIGDGDESWTVDAGHASAAAPAVHDGTVYLTVWNGGESVPRGLVAVDAADGTERWRALTDNDVNASPTPTDDAVFVGGGFENSAVAAVEHDGTVRWRRDLGVYAAAPAVVDALAVYATGESGSVVALDTETGETVWERSVDGRTTAAPAVVGESVVVADETGTVRRLDATTGEEKWHATVDGRVDRSVAVDDVAVVAHDGGLTALALAGGERRWTTDLDADPTAPILTDDAVLVGAERDVVALARSDGAERWRVETRERSYTDVFLSGVTGSPVVVDGTVVVATQAGDVYALDDG
ncbi:Pyrrolo-quinoline quinone [Haloplanus rubicundus]|uniref:Pyrrolo-quinoline quinone n=1 Tax=Haloplanus rubicundus TaxID=1547898 RepID=A0A345DYY3_9EURY|nr:PQQ-binding-like beta-propeller repeat protein [Haloplanus rubicundus]AXG05155.1 Pyrrolo-quinoline quinone [Haloplanus rubicundus]